VLSWCAEDWPASPKGPSLDEAKERLWAEKIERTKADEQPWEQNVSDTAVDFMKRLFGFHGGGQGASLRHPQSPQGHLVIERQSPPGRLVIHSGIYATNWAARSAKVILRDSFLPWGYYACEPKRFMLKRRIANDWRATASTFS
jgi:hypothetical protein